MSAFSKVEAYKQAVAVVTAGLSSNAIKMSGVNSNVESAKASAAIDSAYLQGLIDGLAKGLMAQDPRNQ